MLQRNFSIDFIPLFKILTIFVSFDFSDLFKPTLRPRKMSSPILITKLAKISFAFFSQCRNVIFFDEDLQIFKSEI
jgi:hypothetical protein